MKKANDKYGNQTDEQAQATATDVNQDAGVSSEVLKDAEPPIPETSQSQVSKPQEQSNSNERIPDVQAKPEQNDERQVEQKEAQQKAKDPTDALKDELKNKILEELFK